jgi:hypothetical protein
MWFSTADMNQNKYLALCKVVLVNSVAMGRMDVCDTFPDLLLGT